MLFGVLLTVLAVSLTSGKNPSEDNTLQVYSDSQSGATYVFNQQTKTIYMYFKKSSACPCEKPDRIIKVASDGSSLSCE